MYLESSLDWLSYFGAEQHMAHMHDVETWAPTPQTQQPLHGLRQQVGEHRNAPNVVPLEPAGPKAGVQH